eukprot:gene27841-34622_t
MCLVLHVSFSRKCLREVYRLIFTTEGTTFFTSNNITCTIMVLIVIVYFSLRIVLQCGYLRRHTDSMSRVLIARICVHMFLASVAAILPARAIRSMLVAMKHEMETKKTFIRYISHEIRSPLSTACLGLDYLIDQMTSHKLSYDSALEVVRDTKIAAEIATSTLNDLLMFDKIETGMLEVATADCDMWEFVNHCVKPFQLQASADQVTLSCNRVVGDDMTDLEARSQELLVKIDKYKMEQVVRNFLTNALKFTPEEGNISVNVMTREAFSSAPQKQASVTETGDLTVTSVPVIRVEVVDSGPGITAENLPKLFGQYVQFDANTLQGGKGSGLGLWLSKAIVEMHGGVIGATSPGVGLGCTFFLELPLMNVDHFLRGSGSSSKPGSFGAALATPSQSGRSDEATKMMASVQMVAVLHKKAKRYRTIAVSPKKKKVDVEAITNLRVLLTDDSTLSRRMAVQLIREQGYRGVVLAVTGVSTDSEFTSLLGKGVDRILVKPFSLEVFKQVMLALQK